MEIVNTQAGGNLFDKAEKEGPQMSESIEDLTDDDDVDTPVRTFDDLVSGWFKFVQTEDGSIPSVYHAREESSETVNFKKSISAAFQANFEGTNAKVEADPQSLHVAKYT